MRPFREEDVDAYAAVLQTRQVRASLHLPDDVGREHAWLGMAQQLGQWELRGTGQWALEEQATGAFVGQPCTPGANDSNSPATAGNGTTSMRKPGEPGSGTTSGVQPGR